MEIKGESKKIYQYINGWNLSSFFVCLLFLLPYFGLTLQFKPEYLKELFTVLFSDAAINTYLLLFFTSTFAMLFSVVPAWMVSAYDFPGKKIFEWALILPLAVPGYIQAYTYKGILDPFGTTKKWFGFSLEVDNWFYLSILLASVLYPYIYLMARSVFLYQSNTLIHASISMGKSYWQTFYKVVFPLASPAIFSGLLLIMMEVLNEYGAVSYYGVKTFSSEIVRLWNPMELGQALKFAWILLVFVGLFLFVEKRIKRGKKYFERGGKRLKTLIPSRNQKYLFFITCMIPFLLGFVIPVIQLMIWAVSTLTKMDLGELASITFYTFQLAGGTALICITISFVFHFTLKNFQNKFWRGTIRASSIGYAIPGAVIGVLVLFPLEWINEQWDILLTGNAFILIYAYCLRFQTVSFNSLRSGTAKVPPNLFEASLSMGKSKWYSFTHVDWFYLKPSLITGFLLVFIDVCKELPLTMMFQSFNLETLAVKAFTLMETDGAVYDSSIPSLLIIGLSCIPVWMLNKSMKRD